MGSATKNASIGTSNADARILIVFNVGLLTPCSILAIWEMTISARVANSCCDRFLAVLKDLSRSPKSLIIRSFLVFATMSKVAYPVVFY